MVKMEIFNRTKNERLKPIECPNGPTQDPIYCPNCDRFLEDSEIKILYISHGAGDRHYLAKHDCKICKATYNVDTYSNNAFGGSNLEVISKWKEINKK